MVCAGGFRIEFQGRRRAVEVHVQGGFLHLNGFHSPPLPEPFNSSLDCDTIPVDAVVCLLNIICSDGLRPPRFSACLVCAHSI